MSRWLLIVTLGCSAPTRPPPTIEGRAAPATPATGRAPNVAWIDNGFDANGIPAVTSDGAQVVLAFIDNDGGRGNPNLRLVVRGRTDRDVETKVVMSVDEAETLFDASGKTAELDARITATNNWLRAFHARAGLVALLPLETVRAEDAPLDEQRVAWSDELEVRWKASQLTITQAGKPLHARRTPEDWLVKDQPLCATCTETCSNPAHLAGAAIDVARRIAVVSIGYTGNDTCWEPPYRHHVIAW